MKVTLLKCCVFFAVIAISIPLNAQVSTRILDSLLLNESYAKADSSLYYQIEFLKENSLIDSLYKYPYYVGRISYLKSSNSQESMEVAERFTKDLIAKSNKRTQYKSLLNLANFYDELGQNSKSLEVTESALKILKTITDASGSELGRVTYNLGATQLSLGDIVQAKANFLDAMQDYESDPSTLKTDLSDAYNAVGASMWLTSKLDSAKVYYKKAEETIVSSKGDPIENLYLATVIKSNVSLLAYSQGKLSEAIDIQNAVIANYQKVIVNSKDENTVTKARRFQLDAITNLSVFYNEQGNMQKALEVLNYAYMKRKEISEPDNIDLIASNIQIGQAHLSLLDFETSKQVLEASLEKMDQFNIDNPYWRATAWHALAEVELGLGKSDAALSAFEKSEIFFGQSLEGSFDAEYINFLRNKALFMSSKGNYEEALETAERAYNAVSTSDIDNSQQIKMSLSIADIHFQNQHYLKSKTWYTKAQKEVEANLSESRVRADSIEALFYMPRILVGLSKLQMNKVQDEQGLRDLLDVLDSAAKILEQRKSSVFKSEDVGLLLEDYRAIADLSKEIHLKLYERTNDLKYVDRILELHESSIYNRIRLRMNLKNDIGFAGLPKNLVQREEMLKSNLSAALTKNGLFENYLEAEHQWMSFLDSLRVEFPKYYNMRYGQITVNALELQSQIPEVTVIRYLKIGNELYAIVLSSSKRQLVKLSDAGVYQAIIDLNHEAPEITTLSKHLHSLYLKLWQPVASYISTKKVVIIPDGELFNLSFEMLTDKVIGDYNEFSNHSLLSKYIISYNYSSLLVNSRRKPVEYEKNFVAFSPEFDDSMKSDYLAAISDSLIIDRSYLRLLPQPFSKDLAQSYSRIFNGESFLNESASKQIFTKNAKEHKIIHIGTHAESNNMSPELSRLIFAKDIRQSNSVFDNSLYTYEIYDQNLSSNLAILTACETGKPAYQPGEGMISLGHAFNYAGSESILTSLWKIDEQSSMLILGDFYEFLEQGLPKDEALQTAKLNYLKTSEGRLLSPDYWAGLVLIGDSQPIEITSFNPIWYWILGLVLLVFLVIIYRRNFQSE